METALPQLHNLIAARLGVVRQLADSLDASQFALVRNDAEMIARGAAHQAELCRRWSLLEAQLRREQERITSLASDDSQRVVLPEHFADEWTKLNARIRHLTRVHSSLLRHLNRSLAVLARVAESCAPTYSADVGCRRVPRGGAGD